MSNSAEDRAAAGEALRTTIREQIASGEPAEAKLTYDRLCARGLTDDQTVEFMAAVLAAEMFEMLKHQKPYDREHYETALRALPTLPWEQ